MTAEEMWSKYSLINPSAENYEAWAFGGDNPNLLAELVKKGIKTATASAFDLYEVENEKLPEIGSFSIILDKKEEAVCIIKNIKVEVCPFNKVSEIHSYKEGEGDRSLNFWRTCHKKFFTLELNKIGKEFSENMKVVLEEFEVVF